MISRDWYVETKLNTGLNYQPDSIEGDVTSWVWPLPLLDYDNILGPFIYTANNTFISTCACQSTQSLFYHIPYTYLLLSVQPILIHHPFILRLALLLLCLQPTCYKGLLCFAFIQLVAKEVSMGTACWVHSSFYQYLRQLLLRCLETVTAVTH